MTPTPAQLRVLHALRDVTADGWPATVREVMRAAGYRSTSTAQRHLENLERLGRAVRHPRNSAGGWRVA